MIYNEKGVALIATLGVVTILCVLALETGRFMGSAAVHTASENEAFEAEETAMSGIHLALLLLSRDAADNQTDSLQEPWADPEKIHLALDEMGIKPGDLSLSIVDELGKIQLNSVLRQFPGNAVNNGQQALLERFLTLARNDKAMESPIEIVNALKDWLDSKDNDAVTGLSGAESDYYESLIPPYSCANGPLRHVTDLFKVKGVTKGFLIRNFLEDGGTEPSDSDKLEPGEVFTVYGLDDPATLQEKRYGYTGKINMNTASPLVLAALLPEGKEYLANDLDTYRRERSGSNGTYTHSLKKGWFENVTAFSDEEKAVFQSRIRYSSHVFRAESTAVKNGRQVRLSAVIKREQQKETGEWICRILQLEKT